MRTALLARGTRGDAQPMALLGGRVHRGGHDLVLGAPPNFVALAARMGFAARAWKRST